MDTSNLGLRWPDGSLKHGFQSALGNWYVGDCLEIIEQHDLWFDYIITSPPYNIRNSTGNGFKAPGGKWSNPALQHGYEEHDDLMDHDAYVAWQRRVLSLLWERLPKHGAIFYNHKWRTQGGLLQDRADIVSGLPVRQIIIWQRAGGINFNDHFFVPDYEVIYLIAKPDFRLKPGENGQGCVWRIPQVSSIDHPAPFPIALPQKIIRAVNWPDRVVLDPFMGSGTTAVAAEIEGMQWIGIEKSQTYTDRGRDRIQSLAATGSLLYEERPDLTQ